MRYLDAQRVRCGDETVDLREPRAVRTPAPAASGPRLVVEDGQVSLRDTDGGRLGRIYPDGPRGAFALLEDGALDPMGDEHPALLCGYGDVLAPLVVCGDRWLAEGGLQRLWAAAPSSRGLSPTR
ncbi:MAG: hypothetical protein KC731_02250 [Myxococcales bacterium]|nr:hypothetical protein [Myxococcales bacterium]